MASVNDIVIKLRAVNSTWEPPPVQHRVAVVNVSGHLEYVRMNSEAVEVETIVDIMNRLHHYERLLWHIAHIAERAYVSDTVDHRLILGIIQDEAIDMDIQGDTYYQEGGHR